MITRSVTGRRETDLADDDVLEDVIEAPVAELMAQDRHYLLVVTPHLRLLLLPLRLLDSSLLLLLGLQLHPLGFLQQSVEQDDPLEPGDDGEDALEEAIVGGDILEEAVEVGVAVAGPFAALDHVELVEGEGDGGGQGLDLETIMIIKVMMVIMIIKVMMV